MLHYSAKPFRLALAMTLSLWIAGGGCLLGCQNMAASAAPNEPNEVQSAGRHLSLIVSGEACATNQGHDCCAKKKAEEAKAKAQGSAKPSLEKAILISQTQSLSPEPSGRMKDCPLALSRAVVLTKTGANKQTSAPAVLPRNALTVETTTEQHTSLSPVARLPNRGHTYLRCCVFLI
jgi:hypothetical protein